MQDITNYQSFTSNFPNALAKIVENISTEINDLIIRYYLQKVHIRSVRSIGRWTDKDELRALFWLASDCPRGASALEIGSYLGASSCYIAAGLARVNGHLFCVDTWRNDAMTEGRRDTFDEFVRNIEPIRGRITIVRKRSGDLVDNDLSYPLNLVFIDGDHSYTAVKGDFEQVQRWMASDGVIAFHDCNVIGHIGVSHAIGEILSSGNWVIAGMVNSLLWIKPVAK